MSHGISLNINISEVMEAEPIQSPKSLSRVFWGCLLAGVVVFSFSLAHDPQHAWAAYFINLIFWMGLACGSLVIPAILQVVRAEWSPPVRRIAEANVAYLPWAFCLFLLSWFGKESLFSWARRPMPGREWWMEPDFVYVRFGILLAFLFFILGRFVYMSVRSDVGFLREKAKNRSQWDGWPYTFLARNWRGADNEVVEIQRKLSWNAPAVIVLYVIIYSLFAFEMIMGVNDVWYSNLFGGFTFVGNIYLGWAAVTMLVVYSASRSSAYSRTLSTQQLWDLGKLTFGFCMLWGYLFFSQYLPQWYGNLPEETQWLILRSKEYPWKSFAWITFPMCFIIPFILLLSEDLKRTPAALATVSLIIFIGIWCEKYITVMPEISPGAIPFGVTEIGIFFGFLGIYGLSVTSFLKTFPFIPVSSPLTRGDTSW